MLVCGTAALLVDRLLAFAASGRFGCTKIMDPVTLVGERSPMGSYNYMT
jgi:hypothetical protein